MILGSISAIGRGPKTYHKRRLWPLEVAFKCLKGNFLYWCLFARRKFSNGMGRQSIRSGLWGSALILNHSNIWLLGRTQVHIKPHRKHVRKVKRNRKLQALTGETFEEPQSWTLGDRNLFRWLRKSYYLISVVLCASGASQEILTVINSVVFRFNAQERIATIFERLLYFCGN